MSSRVTPISLASAILTLLSVAILTSHAKGAANANSAVAEKVTLARKALDNAAANYLAARLEEKVCQLNQARSTYDTMASANLAAVSIRFNPLAAVRHQAQTPFSVRGVVTNEYGNPEPGVSVSERGNTATKAVTSDAKGHYTIQVSSASATLFFRKGGRYAEAPVNSLPVIDRTIRCPKGNVFSGNVCVIPGEAFLPACPPGLTGKNCLPKVAFQPAVNVTMNEARALAIDKGWVMATAEEVLAAWKEQNLDVFAYGMLADGRFAMPVQGDHPPSIKRGGNVGITGGNQGFFYVLRSAVARAQVPPDPKLEKKSTAPSTPSTTLNIGLTIMTPEEQKEYGDRWWQRVMKDPSLASLRYDLICDSTPENVMLDGWNRPERAMLIDAAKLLLAKEGTPATNQAIHDLNVQLTKDPVRRWQFAPFMLSTLWDALTAKNPTREQDIFRTKLEAKTACAETKYAKSILELWNRHIGRSNGIGDGNNFWFGKVDPPKGGATFSVFLDTKTGGSIEGFAQAGAFDNPAGIPQVGGPAVAKLYKPMLFNAFRNLDDTENLAPLGENVTGALIHAGFTTFGVGLLGVSGGTSIVAREVAKVAFTFNTNAAIKVKEVAEAAAEAGEKAAAEAAEKAAAEAAEKAASEAVKKATARQIMRQVVEDIFDPTAKKLGTKTAAVAGEKVAEVVGEKTAQVAAEKAGEVAAEKVAQTVAAQVASKVFTAGVAAVGIILTAAEVFGSAVADRVRTDQFDKTVNERAHNVNLQDIREYLGANPTEMQKVTVFNQLVNMVIAEPAARGDLTFELPDIKCGPGTVMSHYNNRVCVRTVKFHSEPNLTFQQARDKARSQGWDLATQAEVLEAWDALDFDAYAYGRTAEGTFAVPVQTDHPNYKIGANLGAVGGNQGFFYVTGKVNIEPAPDGYVRIQNFESPNLFIDAAPNLDVRAFLRSPKASIWKIVPASSGLVRIQSAVGDMYINNQGGTLQVGAIQPNWLSALWKLEPSDGGAVRIQNQWYKDRYLYVQNGRLQLGPIQPGQEGALWYVGGEGRATTRENLAKAKAVKQSSLYPGGDASKAVDGNTDGNWAHGSVSHTQGLNGSWLEIDLGDVYTIDEIRLYNRTDCCRERLNNFRILVGDKNAGLVTYDENSVFVNSTEFIDENPRVFTNRKRGRYVKIQLNGTGFLSFAEVEIYGTP